MGLRSILGAASLKAKDYVSAFQDPFGKTLSDIYDPIKKASDAGTLTFDQANDAFTQFNQQWQAFDEASSQWKQRGGDYAKVVGQAYDPNGKFMKTVNSVKGDLTNWTGALKPTDPAKGNSEAAPPTLQTILTGLGLTPDGAAAGAAGQQKKRSAAATNTLLTGGRGLSELSSANRQYKTLLGY